MALSKSQADKAGARLSKAADPSAPELERYSVAVDEWRALHGAPLVLMAESLQNRLGQVARHVAVGQRLKRKAQIIAKLKRTNTRLAQMQDVGGCRAVLDSPAEVVLAAEKIEQRSNPWYEIENMSDYRARGRSDTGYRALHLVAMRDGRSIEIQLRTLRQQAWAEGIERAANRSGFDLKSGAGPAELVEFFRLASDAFHALDSGQPVPPALKKELKTLKPIVDTCMPEADTGGRPPPAKIRRQEFRSVLNNWLIVYDWKAAQFVAWSDLGTAVSKAAQTYASFEGRYRYEDGYEVVMIGADSTDTIKRTHAHYFGKDPNDFDPLNLFAEVLAA